MAYTRTTFAVQISKPQDEIALGMRIALTDYIRAEFRRSLDGGAVAGVDPHTVAQRFGLLYAQAAASYRLCRAVPAAMVQWACHVEFNSGDAEYPAALPRSVGTFNRDVVTCLPGGTVLIRMGGVNLVGIAETPISVAEIAEVRVFAVDRTFSAEIITGRSDNDSRFGVTVPADFEREDA